MRLVARALVLCGFLGFVACGDSSNSSDSQNSDSGAILTDASMLHAKVFGGVEISQSLAPHVVRIDIVNGSTGGTCSGTVIGSNSVITATHCFLDPNLSAVSINILGQQIGVSEIIVAPGFAVAAPALFNDVTILKTSQPLPAPALPLALGPQLFPGLDMLVFGYGLNEAGALGILRIGTINPDTITTNHIIDDVAGGQNTCPGDSGGPVIAMFEDSLGNQIAGLVGLTSSGTGGTCTNIEIAYYVNLQEAGIANFIVGVVPDAILF